MKPLRLRLPSALLERFLIVVVALLLIAFVVVLLVQPSAVGRGGR
jgi:hypothetical protein